MPMLMLLLLATGFQPLFAGIGTMMLWLVYAALIGVSLAGWWCIFIKAGQPGWAALIPIYNTIVLLQITDKPLWWIVLMFIPCVNLVVAVMVFVELANRFGKGGGFAVGLLLLGFIFAPILGFGDARYTPPGGGQRRRRPLDQEWKEDEEEGERRPGRQP